MLRIDAIRSALKHGSEKEKRSARKELSYGGLLRGRPILCLRIESLADGKRSLRTALVASALVLLTNGLVLKLVCDWIYERLPLAVARESLGVTYLIGTLAGLGAAVLVSTALDLLLPRRSVPKS